MTIAGALVGLGVRGYVRDRWNLFDGTIVLINPTRNTMPLDGSMDAFEYCYYLRRLTYGLLSVSGCGRDWKSWEDYRQARPTLADNYGQSPTGPPIVQVSGDLQERAGYMSMGKK